MPSWQICWPRRWGFRLGLVILVQGAPTVDRGGLALLERQGGAAHRECLAAWFVLGHLDMPWLGRHLGCLLLFLQLF